jgi:hypothetical protein
MNQPPRQKPPNSVMVAAIAASSKSPEHRTRHVTTVFSFSLETGFPGARTPNEGEYTGSGSGPQQRHVKPPPVTCSVTCKALWPGAAGRDGLTGST